MNTVGRNKWPLWLIKVIGERRNIEVKEHAGKYYAYSIRYEWNKKIKRQKKISTYLGRITESGISTTYETSLRGMYEYGHVRLLNHLFETSGVLQILREIFPKYWREIFAFTCNRVVDPRPIKSMGSWCEKTYMQKALGVGFSPKRISRMLEEVGKDWNSQVKFFDKLIVEGDKLAYDGSLLISSSGTPLAEFRVSREEKFAKRVGLVVAFSWENRLPIFFRLLPGSLHEISTLRLFLEEIEGKRLILVLDKGFAKEEVYHEIDKSGHGFIISLKRNSARINYEKKMKGFFMFHDRPIKYCSYRSGKFHLYLYEDISLRAEEEKTYYTLLSKGGDVSFKKEWAGKIALLSNMRIPPNEIYEMWKGRDEIERALHVLQNLLDTDTPYVRKDEIFKGYVFASFVGLIGYYMALRLLKEAGINSKVSVSDLMLELSKVYVMELKGKEFVSELTKRVRKLVEELGLHEVITKIGWR